MKNNHLIIMAGGIGSRFWPMSTPQRPKQFIDVLGTGRSLIQMTVDRFKGICPSENIWVVTSKMYKDIVMEQIPEIPESNILLEPCMRNTAPCIAYVSWKIKLKNKNANLVISAADHIVTNEMEFRRIISNGLEFTANTDNILTLGIKPHRAETGYGYIKKDTTKMQNEINRVDRFCEKPDILKAQEYLASGDYLWNSGIFLWNINTVEKAMRNNQADIANIFDSIEDTFYTDREQESIDKYFPTCPNISVDYAIMEKAENIWVYPSDFGWSDLGTWGSLYEQLNKDTADNAAIGGKISIIESKDCIVHTPKDKNVVIQGLNGYIVAEYNNSLLICKKSEEQRIKEFSSSIQ